MEASKNVDAYGLFPGNALQKADGEQAYIQAPLGGIRGEMKTWARLPRDMWPDSFKGLRDPVVPVHKAIYGHPQSGGHWEEGGMAQRPRMAFRVLVPQAPSLADGLRR